MGLGMDLSWNPSGGPMPRPAAPTRRIDLGGGTHGMDPQAPCRSLGLGDLGCLTGGWTDGWGMGWTDRGIGAVDNGGLTGLVNHSHTHKVFVLVCFVVSYYARLENHYHGGP